jgi:hypothetical protein
VCRELATVVGCSCDGADRGAVGAGASSGAGAGPGPDADTGANVGVNVGADAGNHEPPRSTDALPLPAPAVSTPSRPPAPTTLYRHPTSPSSTTPTPHFPPPHSLYQHSPHQPIFANANASMLTEAAAMQSISPLPSTYQRSSLLTRLGEVHTMQRTSRTERWKRSRIRLARTSKQKHWCSYICRVCQQAGGVVDGFKGSTRYIQLYQQPPIQLQRWWLCQKGLRPMLLFLGSFEGTALNSLCRDYLCIFFSLSNIAHAYTPHRRKGVASSSLRR